MRQLKKTIILITLLLFATILLFNSKVFADNIDTSFQKVEYSEDFKKWLELSDEEKQNVIMPRMYEIENTNIGNTSLLYMVRMLRAGSNSSYSLKDIIPSNLVIRNQEQTNSCWAFAALSTLETNLALYNAKRGINLSRVYDFSERHMEYATSKTFANNSENEDGYNRNVGSGGNYQFAASYLTNGTGAIPENEMPFENNENIIDINQIQNKTVSSQVYDTIEFTNYRNVSSEQKTEIMNEIKQHIQNYGAVFVSLHGNSSSTTGYSCYNYNTGAKYCNNTSNHAMDHAATIIGWDDNYSIDNFAEGAKPTSNGAWIVRNSWGEQYGNNGIIYVSYEDVNISTQMFGIVKATDTVDYDNIYQYDKFYPAARIELNNNKMMICNVFEKQTEEKEYLTQVSLYTPETYTCKVYVNPNGTSKSRNDLQLVSLKAGESETFDAGYHTIEFSEPIEIEANSFTVVIEIQSSKNSITFPLESKVNELREWDSVTVESGKCFIAIGNNLENCQWIDTSKLTEVNPNLVDGDTTIKAFTITEVIDDSLKNIEIVTPPNKTSYFEGENFDKTGMVVKANYNSETKPSVILDNSSYNIVNGTNLKVGQTSVTITYEDKSVNQTISVEKNSVIELKIKTPPTKTEYKEGESFNSSGMVIEATYKDGNTKIIEDYTIEDGNNIKANQNQVTISYEGNIIKQDIKVTPNPLIEIMVTKAPNKTNYIVGQNFDKTGMVVTGVYQDETTQEIIDYIIENGTNLKNGQTSITIKYEEKEATQSITVEEKNITEISINKMPSKIQYIQNKETLDLTGGSIKINYNDNSSEEIEMINEQIKVNGFNNEKIGKNTITLTYKEKTITFEVEIVAEDVPKNSNFDIANCNINNAKYYTFSNENTQEYIIIDITVNEISKHSGNDSYKYYYYISSNKDEKNIEDWVRITENQTANDRLEFKVNTKDINNYIDILNSNSLYLYIKEVAIKGGSQSVAASKAIAMNLSTTTEIEIYLDNTKLNNTSNYGNSGNSYNSNQNQDNTMAPDSLPQAGVKNILIIISVISIITIVFYVRYKKLSKIY